MLSTWRAKMQVIANKSQEGRKSALLFGDQALFDDKHVYFHKHRGILS
jgi:hypothetical protein